MCHSSIATIVADLLEIFGVLALIVGFFSGMTNLGTQNQWSAGVFLLGIVALVVGTRLSSLC